ncbi:Clp protease N-terminal domain-containing protein [Actinoallomurus sp. NPDC052274]|uniref:Clp protease N-terminal domain-containing protein n=1 Tax=Actinoallomurus sp. NPDC052274 TaxID=3155420 RepID=UPI003446705A
MSHEVGMYIHSVMERAACEAQEAGSATIEAEHLLLAIAAEHESTTQRLLSEAGLEYPAISDALEQEFKHSLSTAGVTVGELPRPSRSPKRPSRIGATGKLVLERGMATVASKKDLRPAHLLLGVLQLNVGTVPRALALAGVDQADLAERVRQAVSR